MLGLGRPIITKDELAAHRTMLGNQQDVIYAPLYDSNSYVASTGATQLTFFTSPVGQGTTSAPGATGNKTLADTNLNSAGQLTKGNEFYMTGQEFMFFPGVSVGPAGEAISATGMFANDVYTLGKSGFVTLQVGSNRQYIQDGPLIIFPPSARLAVGSALAGTTTAGTQELAEVTYAVWAGEPYDVTPIYIEANQGFQEFIQWPAAVTLPSAVNARLFSRMRGYLVRNVQ